MTTKRRIWSLWLVSLLSIVAFVAVACGDDDDDNGGDPTNTPAANGETPAPTEDGGNGGGEIDYGSLSGNVDIDGSSTVFPISQAMAEEFSRESDVRVNVGLSGTGGGFEKFCRGEIQIADASRPIRDSEVQACADNGIDDIVELQIAIDALTVVVNPDNDWAQCLTVDEVVSIFRNGGVRNWNEVREGFPDEPIVLYYPGADSGTFDYFVEVLEDHEEGAVHASDGTSSEDDNILVLGVEGDLGAVGYFGLSYYLGAGQGLTGVQIDDGEGCVEPSVDTALEGSYAPYSRPLFIYTREEFLENNPEVLGFVWYYLTEQLEDIVLEVGYAPMPEDLLNETIAKVEPFLP